MAGVTNRETNGETKERADMNESEVQNLMDTLKLFQNPFSYNVPELINVSTGEVVSESSTMDILCAYEKGKTVAINFVRERLVNKTVDFHALMKKAKIPSFNFTTFKSSKTAKTYAKELKLAKELLTKLLIIARDRHLDLRELLSQNLTRFSPSIGSIDGSLGRTTKAALLPYFENTTPNCLVKEQHHGGTLVIDGMALIQEIADYAPATYSEYSIHLLRHSTRLATSFNTHRVDFVTDRYESFSIKNAERNRRADGSQQCVQRPLSSDQKFPQVVRTFLKSGKSKESLCQFLVSHWMTLDGKELGGKVLYATQGQRCLLMSTNANNVIITEEVDDLESNHEEADTRLLLHAKHASVQGSSSVVIRSPDTDIFIMSIVEVDEINTPLYFATGTGNKSRLLHINAITEKLGEPVGRAILGLHAFTGSDSTSSFKSKGKIKPLKLMLQDACYKDVFASLGQVWDLSKMQLDILEEFVCRLYGQTVNSVNEARYQIFMLSCKFDDHIPPNLDSLTLQAKRANYQTALWRHCLTSKVDKPSPLSHGWMLDPDDGQSLVVKWMDVPPGLSKLIQFVKCGCKGNCNSKRCNCKSAEMRCTEVCQCTDKC